MIPLTLQKIKIVNRPLDKVKRPNEAREYTKTAQKEKKNGQALSSDRQVEMANIDE